MCYLRRMELTRQKHITSLNPVLHCIIYNQSMIAINELIADYNLIPPTRNYINSICSILRQIAGGSYAKVQTNRPFKNEALSRGFHTLTL